MSPAKSAAKGKPAKTLTIEFSGISTLVWNRKSGTADVHLVDMASAGFQRHYAALGLAVTESTPHGIKGPNADAAVSVPGQEMDMGLWNLIGTNVEIVGASGKVTVDNKKVDVTKKPAADATSIQWLANIGFLCESAKMSPVCSTAAVVHLPAGHITATGAAVARKLEFAEDGTPVGPERYCMPRFKIEIPFASELAIRLSRERVLRFTDSMTVIISNTCVCGLGLAPTENHFYGHYDVVQAKRRPTVRQAGPQPMIPWWPDICYGGFVEA